MGIREGLQRHPTAFTLAAIAVIAASVGLVIYAGRSGSRNGPPAPSAYFYDQNTRTLLVAPSQPGPIETASGPYQGEPAGVRAHVFACGRCSEEANRFIGWLSKPAPAAGGAAGTAAEELIRRPQDEKWFPANSPQAERIIQEVYHRCQRGVKIQYCSPEHSR